METIEIQYLGKKEDLELLVAGDKVNVKLQNFKGVATFLYMEEGSLRFTRKDKNKILRYYIEEFNIEIKDNTIVQRTFNTYSEPEVISDKYLYEFYNKLIGESD